MASPYSVLKNALSLNGTVVESWELATETVERYAETSERAVVYVHARPYLALQCLCPECGKRCPRNGFKQEEESTWRAPDLNGVPVLIKYRPQRIKCPEHGALNERVPWADGGGRFTEDFN